MTLRIGKFCGNGPEVWLGMQAAPDLWHAARTIDVGAIPTMTAA